MFFFVCLFVFFFCNGFLEKKLIFTETAFCGLLPLQGCTPQCYRVERLLVSVTRESEPTNSTDFDPIFTDHSPVLFRNIVGCSKFVEDSFEWPRMLLELARDDARNFRFAMSSQFCRCRQWKVSSSFIMSLNYLYN